ncbi:MAG: methenyltetrahydromethanopterin cyclohydrolase [Mariniblastus sp.]|jgi:methenyltetrahydromethanopterin cyclohydrolase
MNKTAMNAQLINTLAFQIFESSANSPESYGVRETIVGGARVLDFATGREGSTKAGILLSQICMGGLGEIVLGDPVGDLNLRPVHVQTDSPLEACMGSQYAGWPVANENYFGMGSGPMRMLRGKEEVLSEYGLVSSADHAVGVLESNHIPDESIVKLVASECGVSAEQVCLCVARTASYPGSLQVVARSVETAMHKLHALEFDLGCVVSATGVAPLPPIAADDMTALGWTNDSILYGASVNLTVETDDSVIEKIVNQVPSCSSEEFGVPFLDIFNKYDKDFYKIDKLLFSPAKVVFHNLQTGNSFEAGEVRSDILKRSFGI